MSTILKAIDRLEREKQKRNDERPLREEIAKRHVVSAPSHSATRIALFAVGAGVVLLGVGLAVGLSGVLTSKLDSRADAGQTAPQVGMREATVPDNDAALSRRPEEIVSRGALENLAAAPAPRRSAPDTPPDSRSLDTEGPLVAVIHFEPAAKPTVPAERIARAAPSSRTRKPDDETPLRASIIPSVSAAPPEALSGANARTAPAKEIAAPAAVSEATRAIRDVVVARTIWHPDSGRRFALIEISGHLEPLRVREGDAVGPLLVRKIEPSGVVFLDDGVEIRRRVGARD